MADTTTTADDAAAGASPAPASDASKAKPVEEEVATKTASAASSASTNGDKAAANGKQHGDKNGKDEESGDKEKKEKEKEKDRHHRSDRDHRGSSRRDRDKDRDRDHRDHRSSSRRDRDRGRDRHHGSSSSRRRHHGSSSSRRHRRSSRSRSPARRHRRRHESSSSRRRRRRGSSDSDDSGSDSDGRRRRKSKSKRDGDEDKSDGRPAGSSVADVLKSAKMNPLMMNPMMMGMNPMLMGMNPMMMNPSMMAVMQRNALTAAAAATAARTAAVLPPGATPGSAFTAGAAAAATAAAGGAAGAGAGAAGTGAGTAGAGGTPNVAAILAKVNAQLGGGAVAGVDPSTKSHRELYVGNLPPGSTGPQVQQVLGNAMVSMKLTTQPGNPIINSWMSADGTYCFVEFRSIEETNNGLTLNQVPINGHQLRIGRPKSYTGGSTTASTGVGMAMPGAMPGLMPGLALPGLAAANAAAAAAGGAGGAAGAAATAASSGPVVLMVSNMPDFLDGDGLNDIVKEFGKVSKVELQKDTATQKSKGVALVHFEDATGANTALAGLNGLKIVNNVLIAQRAPAGMLNAGSAKAAEEAKPQPVLILSNMTTPDMLADAEEVQELSEDVSAECSQFGKIVELHVPQVGDPGAGHVFVHFETAEASAKAADKLKGRKFDGRSVGCQFMSVEKFQAKQFDDLN